jgi:tetratricopeptide (TPR) repeat protein
MLQLGRPADAQSAWEYSLRLNPSNHAASWNLASLEIDFGQYDRAVERLTALAAQFLSPSSADGEPRTSLPGAPDVHRNLGIDLCGVHLQRARALVGLMQHDQAFEDLSRAATHDPTNLRVIEARALLHLQRDEIEQALADCDRMVRLTPCDEASYALRARVCYESGDLEGALADLHQAEIFADNPGRIRLMRGQILCNGGRIEDARMVLDELLAENPSDGEALYLRAHCWRSLGLHREQRDDLVAALAVQPNDPKILNSLAWLYATCTDESIRDGRQAIHFGRQLVALTAARNPHYLDTLAAAYAEAGQADEACREMRRAIALFKVHPPPWGLDRYRQRLALFERGEAYRE